MTLQLGMDGSAFVSLTEGVFTAANVDFRLRLLVMPMSGAWCPVQAVPRRISTSRWCGYRLKGFGVSNEEDLSRILTRDTLSRVFQRQDIIEATVRADSTEITVDSTLVTADGLIRQYMRYRPSPDVRPAAAIYRRTIVAITAMMTIITATISHVRAFLLCLACCPVWKSLSRTARCASHRVSCSCRVS